MNIIDTNVFYGRWPFRHWGEEDMGPIKDRCRGNGVDGMLVSSVHSIFYEDPFEAEEELHQRVHNRAAVHDPVVVELAEPEPVQARYAPLRRVRVISNPAPCV